MKTKEAISILNYAVEYYDMMYDGVIKDIMKKKRIMFGMHLIMLRKN